MDQTEIVSLMAAVIYATHPARQASTIKDLDKYYDAAVSEAYRIYNRVHGTDRPRT